MDGGTLVNPYAKRGSDATAADDNINERDGNSRSGILSKNKSRAPSTIIQDKAAVDVLNYYLVFILGADEIDDIDLKIIEADVESFLTVGCATPTFQQTIKNISTTPNSYQRHS
jgi:hypothetical protein